MSETDETKARLDAARKKLMLGQTVNATQVRRVAEKVQAKKRVDRRELRRTGRTTLFPFRCSPELVKQVKAAAAKQGMPIAAWMEMAIEAALGAGDDA